MPSCRCVFHAATANVIDSSTISGTEDDSSEDRVLMEKEEESGRNFYIFVYGFHMASMCCCSVHILLRSSS